MSTGIDNSSVNSSLYSVLFYSILFFSTLFYSDLFCSIVLYSIQRLFPLSSPLHAPLDHTSGLPVSSSGGECCDSQCVCKLSAVGKETMHMGQMKPSAYRGEERGLARGRGLTATRVVIAIRWLHVSQL